MPPMELPKVFVSRRISQAGIDLLSPHCDLDIWEDALPPPYDLLLERVRGVEGLLCLLTDRIDAGLIAAAGPQLKVISQMAVGVDNIDLDAARQQGIPVGNTPGVLTEATADLAFALLMATARRLPEAVDYIRQGRWQTWEPEALLGVDVYGATLGIIGLGRIGQAMARRARGFDMRLLAYSPSSSAETAREVGATLVDLDTLLREADFVSLHVPYKPDTHHLIDAARLAQMKASATLINTARGGVVDQDALVAALQAGTIARAGLDVTTPEPLPSDSPLLSLPNLVLLPHIGSASRSTRDRMATMAAENLLAGLRGDALPHPAG